MTITHCHGPLPSLYTSSQIDQYLEHIAFPRSLLNGSRDLNFLNILHALQIAAVPYENLSLHYNPDHGNDIDPQALFAKIVTNKRGRGGYCMETAIFWREILRGLGFHTYTAAARIRLRHDGIPQGDFVGWRHVTNIVTLPTGKYSSDVGFGGDGETFPLPLSAAAPPEKGFVNLGTQRIRLIQAPFPGALVPEHNIVWQYQYRNNEGAEWSTYYVFPETETFDADFVILNYYTSKSPDSFQVQSPLVVKFLLSGKGLHLTGAAESIEELGAEQQDVGTGGHGLIAGKLMLAGNVVKRNLGGKTETLLVCHTEEERVAALQKYFRLHLTDEEQSGIRGFGSEIRSEDS